MSVAWRETEVLKLAVFLSRRKVRSRCYSAPTNVDHLRRGRRERQKKIIFFLHRFSQNYDGAGVNGRKKIHFHSSTIFPKNSRNIFLNFFCTVFQKQQKKQNFHCFSKNYDGASVNGRKKFNFFSPRFSENQQKKNSPPFSKNSRIFFFIFCHLFLCKLVICLPLPLSREHSLIEFNGMWWPIWQVKVDKRDIF